MSTKRNVVNIVTEAIVYIGILINIAVFIWCFYWLYWTAKVILEKFL
jgi:hypothetical protein